MNLYRELAKTNPAFRLDLATSSSNLANLSIQRGQIEAAVPLRREVVSNEVLYLQGQLPLLPEARRQPLIETFGNRWLRSFSLAGNTNGGTSLALFTRLNRHGLLQDIERRQALLKRAPGPQQELVENLSATTARLADTSLGEAQRQDLQRQREELEQQLYRQLPALQPRLVNPADVARALPADGVLVEFQRYAPYDPSQPEEKRWGEPRYLALLLTSRRRHHHGGSGPRGRSRRPDQQKRWPPPARRAPTASSNGPRWPIRSSRP